MPSQNNNAVLRTTITTNFASFRPRCLGSLYPAVKKEFNLKTHRSILRAPSHPTATTTTPSHLCFHHHNLAPVSFSICISCMQLYVLVLVHKAYCLTNTPNKHSTHSCIKVCSQYDKINQI